MLLVGSQNYTQFKGEIFGVIISDLRQKQYWKAKIKRTGSLITG